LERLALKPRRISLKALSAMAVALTLLGSTAALAQYDANRGATGQQQIENRNSAQDQRGSSDNQQGRDQNRNDDQGANRYQQQSQNVIRDNPHWSKGDRLPTEYRSNQYVVSDWKNNHLRKPPRGYHWVQANNQYVLAAVASGVIADIMMGNQNERRTR
jgi:Ni/Co efflux regulator RcnB